MEIIKNQEFGGERPLYARHDLYLENVIIHKGESSLKRPLTSKPSDANSKGSILSGNVGTSPSGTASSGKEPVPPSGTPKDAACMTHL